MLPTMRKGFLCIFLLSLIGTFIILFHNKTILFISSIYPLESNECFQTFTMSDPELKNLTITSTNKEEVAHAADGFCSNHTCPTPNYLGYIGIKTDTYDLKSTSKHELSFVQNGGWWLPTYCKQGKSVAILVVYRDRRHHLEMLLRHLHPILRRQQLHYRIFVIQQDKEFTFNRGKLFNVGVLEVLKIYPFNCIIMHDVDLIPEDDRIDYGCTRSPALLSILIDKFKYKSIGMGHFGGVTAMTTKHYFKVNGFTNNIWAWGGEDDNLNIRLELKRLRKVRKNQEWYRYTMLKHGNRLLNRTKEERKEIFRILDNTKKDYLTDGVNSAVYRVNNIIIGPLYTLIDVNLMKDGK